MQVDLIKILAVGSGGFIGAVGRYLLAGYTESFVTDTSFPFGTALVNLLGCFLIGLLAGLFEIKEWINPETRLFLFAGVLGGFTTFSTFANESFVLWERGEVLLGLLNIGVQVLLGVLFVWLGYVLTRFFS